MPTMIVLPPCPDPWFAATSGWPGGAWEVTPRSPPEELALAVGYDGGAAFGGAEDWPSDCARGYCENSRRSTEAGSEAKGLETESWESRVDMSALQPANPTDISASA